MLYLYVLVVITLIAISIVLPRRRAQRKKAAEIRLLRAWIVENQMLDPVLQLWAQHLTATEAGVFLDLLRGYCSSLKWELNWLFTPQIEKAPELKAALEEGVGDYARNILLSVQMEDDVKAYYAYLDFAKNPGARSQRLRVNRLYQRLAEGDALPSDEGILDRFSAKASTRRERIAAIKHVFDRDPARAMQALKEVVITEEIALAQQADPLRTTASLTTQKVG